MSTILLILGFFFLSLVSMSRKIESCMEVQSSGTYLLSINGMAAFTLCDQETDFGGWTTLINRQGDDSVIFNQEFNLLSTQGVGNTDGDFMLPVRLIHLLTLAEPQELLV